MKIPLSLFFSQLGRFKTKKKSTASRRNLLRAMIKKKWGAPKGNQNWRGRLKKA
jgi:hypothetical protein